MRATGTAQSHELKLLLLGGGALLALVLFMGAQAPAQQQATARPEQVFYHGLPDVGAHPRQASRVLQELVKRSHGDYSRLSADEQNWVDGMTGGHGAPMLRLFYTQRAHAYRGKAGHAVSRS